MSKLIEIATEIVAAYVANNSVASGELPDLIGNVYAQLVAVRHPKAAPADPKPAAAVPVLKSIHKDHLVCLICGGHYKSLKRHLIGTHKTTPADYRASFDLSKDYPMVPAAYAEMRSGIAKAAKLGQQQRKPKLGLVVTPELPEAA